MERRDLSALCVGPAGYLARRRSRSAACDGRTAGSRLAACRGRVAVPRRSVATLAVGRGLPFLAVLSACPRTRRPAPGPGALCLIAQQIAGSGPCPAPAEQRPARNDRRSDDEERRHAALRQNANQDLDHDGEQESEYWAQQDSTCDCPPSPIRNTVHSWRRL